ncbi:hypothetical protein FV219_00815 [Methylobacterium sp. WL122]|nr:hypothetical protein FV219_00815 [Methylobacterium sp. WL122]
MSSFPDLYEFEHIIPEGEVCGRASRLLDALVAAGEEPAGLDQADFAPIVVKMQVQDLIYGALNLGIAVREPRWSLTDEGAARVIFPFASAADAVTFQTILL